MSAVAVGQTEEISEKQIVNQKGFDEPTKLENLTNLLQNGKPTFAYFYYSIACSCTAVQCSLAAEAIARTEDLNSGSDIVNYISIDAYYEAEAESLHKCQIVPLIVGFNSKGEEVGRIDWDVDKEAIEMILGKIIE
jgi:hypothetical protein